MSARRRLLVSIGPLLLVGVLASCGGGDLNRITGVPSLTGGGRTVSVLGHRCRPDDFVMQCALTKPKVGVVRAPAPTVAYGVDFAWSCPNPQAWGFGASYLSFDQPKNWTTSCVARYHAAGSKTVPVWETSANRATQGFNAGYNDAFSARSQARALGMPDSRPIDYAVDCDCPLSSIFYYFVGADAGTASILHISKPAAVELVDVYGGYRQVGGLFNAHVVGHTNWQTYAWSGGQWQPASVAPLEQYLNDSSVDYDRAIAPNYGQWPYNPPVVGIRCFGPGAQVHDKRCAQIRPRVARLSHERRTRVAQISAVRRRLFRDKCWVVKDVGSVGFPNPVVRRGPNHDNPTCRVEFARGTSLHQRVAQIDKFTAAATARRYQ